MLCGVWKLACDDSPPGTVRVVGAARELGNLADAHVHDALVPALDDLAQPNVVAERYLRAEHDKTTTTPPTATTTTTSVTIPSSATTSATTTSSTTTSSTTPATLYGVLS